MKKSKIFALYLPQFHETKENNSWWGNGYTDWIAVRKSKPCYKGHNMPRIPLNDNYYDLNNVNILKWQAETAKRYGIDGFCIYHYYSNGKLQMNKPAELLLNNPDIDISYFFSWANHDFKRTWFNGNGELLLKQEYGDENDWANHFHYLKKFFYDKRYLKIDNKPVICIYDYKHIIKFNQMMKFWNKKAIENGFPGIYLIVTKSNTKFNSKEALKNPWIKKVFIFEPMNYRSNGKNGNFFHIYYRRLKTVLKRLKNKIFINHLSYEVYSLKKVFKSIYNRKMEKDELYGIFTDWDNTPRYPGNSIIFKGDSLNLFREFFPKIYEKSCAEEKEIIFINAWNEWGESAYLEPDIKNQYKYLEIILETKGKYNK